MIEKERRSEWKSRAECKCVEQFSQSMHSRIHAFFLEPSTISGTHCAFLPLLAILVILAMHAFSRVDASNFRSLQQLQHELTDLASVLEFCSVHQKPVLGRTAATSKKKRLQEVGPRGLVTRDGMT